MKVTKVVKIMPQLIFLPPVKFYFSQNLSISLLLLGLGISIGIWKSYWKLNLLINFDKVGTNYIYRWIGVGLVSWSPLNDTTPPPHPLIKLGTKAHPKHNTCGISHARASSGDTRLPSDSDTSQEYCRTPGDRPLKPQPLDLSQPQEANQFNY